MADQDKPTRVDTDEARAGSTPHVTRYVLGISMVLIIIVFIVIYKVV